MSRPVIELCLPAPKIRWMALVGALALLAGAIAGWQTFLTVDAVQAAPPAAPTAAVYSTQVMPKIQPTSTATPIRLSPTPVQTAAANDSAAVLETFCRKVPFAEWITAADRLPLATDLSAGVQDQFQVLYQPSCNYDPDNRPEVIVVHYTRGDSLAGAVAALRVPGGPSAHYVIDRDGSVAQMLPESLASAHVSCNASLPDCPALRSISIELVNRGPVNPEYFSRPVFEDYQMSFGYRWWEDFPAAQVTALRLVTEDVARRWKIPIDAQHVLGHYRVNQKIDPGPALNLFWNRFGDPARAAIFGDGS